MTLRKPKKSKKERKKRKKNRDPNSISLLKEKADDIFSVFIRRRDGGRCYTCGKVKEWKYQQCGHFVSRGCNELRYHEKNAHCQCYSCNVLKGGNMIVYLRRMKEKYGMRLINRFLKIHARDNKHWKSQELKDIIEKFKAKVKKLDTQF